MRFFGLKSCDTCKKALKSLQQSGKTPDIIDVRSDGVDQADLGRFYEAFGEDLINRRSTTWRNLNESERVKAPIALLVEYPTLMKRPIIEMDGGELFLGWSSSVQESVLG